MHFFHARLDSMLSGGIQRWRFRCGESIVVFYAQGYTIQRCDESSLRAWGFSAQS